MFNCQVCKYAVHPEDNRVIINNKWWHYGCYKLQEKKEKTGNPHIDAFLAIERAEAEKAGCIKHEPVKPSPEYLIREQLIIRCYPWAKATTDILAILSKHKYKIVDTELYDIVDKRQSPSTAAIPYNNWLCDVQNSCLAILCSTTGSAGKTPLDKNHIAVLVKSLKKTLDQWKNVEYNLY